MTRIVLALVIGVSMAPSIRGMSPSLMQNSGPSGSWAREPGGLPQGAGSNEGFGPSVAIEQTSNELTIQPQTGRTEHYRLDGTESSEVLASSACSSQTRVTRAVQTDRNITISTWMVKKNSCFHGESDLFQPKDPEQETAAIGSSVVGMRTSTGTSRVLESITTISLDGDRLTVETTRTLPSGTSRTSTTSYRR